MGSFDELLDATLAREFNPDPGSGMRQRVLAKALVQGRRIRLWRRGWLGLAASLAIEMTCWTFKVESRRATMSPVAQGLSSVVRGAALENPVELIEADHRRLPKSNQTTSMQMLKMPLRTATQDPSRNVASDTVAVTALTIEPIVIDPLEISSLSSNNSVSTGRVRAQ